MDIRFNCPRCGQHLEVEEKGAGITVNCPSCKQQIEIPHGTQPEPSKISTLATQQKPQSAKFAQPLTAGSAAVADDPKAAPKPIFAEPERRRAPQTLTITVSTTALIVVAAIGFFLWQRGTFAPRASIPEIFKTQLMKFLEEGAKTNAFASQGVTYTQLQQQVAGTKAAYDLISATWPSTLPVGSRQKFERALEGWDLVIQLWQDKIEDRDEPTEPNINRFDRIMAYAPDRLVVETHDYSFIVEEYRGKRYLPFDPNIRVLLTVAGTSFNEGKTEILHALQ